MKSTAVPTQHQSQLGQKGRAGLRAPGFAWYRYMGALSVFVLIFLGIAVLYFLNLVQWSRGPDFGWSITHQMYRMVFIEVRGAAEKAGLRAGDHVIRVNNAEVTSLRQLQDHLVRASTGENVYEVERRGQVLTITVPIEVLGFKNAFLRFGLTWVLGSVFFFVGAIVFIMTPGTRPSWAFLVMMFNAGLYITFTFTSKLSPIWLGTVFIFASTFFPASALHLAQVFPVERRWVRKHVLFLWAPYALSLMLFLVRRSWGPGSTDAPVFWRQLTDLYLVGSLLLFLVSTLYTHIKSSSLIARTRSRVILIGSALAIGFPIADMTITLFLQRPLLPNAVFNLPFFIFFPLSIGYAIAKHDLFAIDLIIRRTCGYVLSTGSIVGAYAVIVSVLNVTFQSAEISRSPLFSVAFALGVIFVFEPLHRRLQSLVDRLFYRQQYDYRKTIRDVSEAMIRILDPEQIHKTLLSSIVREMFLENGILLLPDTAGHGYHVREVEGVEAENLSLKYLGPENTLVRALHEKNEAIFRYEVEADPLYESQREALQDVFQSLASELMLPLKYQDEMRGIISLGRKKSGKMFTPEDLDLLTTMANQSAIALENAKLFEENLEKGRMEEELKIAHDIQVSMLPKQAPKIAGVTIAASSIAAREVGGDFYDFIEIESHDASKSLAIVVGDVSGKAVSGALVMAASRSIFRVLAASHTSVEEVMTIGNACLNRDIKKGMFVALVYAVLDPQQKMLTLSNAGQTQPIISRKDQSAPAYIDTEGDRFPLGIVKRCKYLETHVSLKPGDTLVFYTDGVVEAMNAKEELYGFERFMASIEEGRALGAEALLAKLMDDVSRYVGDAEPHDDLTMVVMQVE
jgi:serine phosphatase RsbU (regulator of sigma subunit)